MTDQLATHQLTIRPLHGALGAVIEGLQVDVLDERLAPILTTELQQASADHHVLFFPALHLTPAQQVRLARVFGSRLAATTETGGDYRGAPTLADEGFPEILVLDTDGSA